MSDSTPAPRSRCRLRRLAWCLALGVFTTILVSWSLAVYVVKYPRTFKTGLVDQWYFVEASGEQCLWLFAIQKHQTGAIWTAINYNNDMREYVSKWKAIRGSLDLLPAWSQGRELKDLWPDSALFMGDFAYGWPFVALHWRMQQSFPPGSDFDLATATPTSAVRAPAFLAGRRADMYLPLRPCWGGFLLDAALFACCWFVLMTAIPAVRRAFRRRRGRCPECNYDLRNLTGDRCPECGLPTSEAAKTTNTPSRSRPPGNTT